MCPLIIVVVIKVIKLVIIYDFVIKYLFSWYGYCFAWKVVYFVISLGYNNVLFSDKFSGRGGTFNSVFVLVFHSFKRSSLATFFIM